MSYVKQTLYWLTSKSRTLFLLLAAVLLSLPTIFNQSRDFVRYVYLLTDKESLAIAAGVAFGIAFLAIVIFVILALSQYIPNIAASLGFSGGPNYEVQVSGEGNIVTIPSKGTTRSQTDDTFLMVLSEKYNRENALSALDNARFRILDHISKLRNNSVTNLFIGIGIAVVGVLILFTAVFQIESFFDRNAHVFDAAGFLTFGLLPKLSITLFVQIFSYFFLAMYRSNQNEIRYFQNEITNIDSLATATILFYGNRSAANAKVVLSSLAKTERNRIIKKNEKSISEPDDVDIIRALGMLSRSEEIIERATSRAPKGRKRWSK
jgi:hypothetical protein